MSARHVDTTWNQCHWVCYFHPAFLCPVLLGMLYWASCKGLKKMLIALGKASYEIFLSQMAVIAVLASLFRANKSWPTSFWPGPCPSVWA